MATVTSDKTRARPTVPGKTTYAERQAPVRAQTPPLFRFSPMMRRLAEDMERVFQTRVGHTLFDRGDIEYPLWVPEMEAFRRGDQVIIHADLPGMSKENVKVEIEDDTLMISGERKDEVTEEGDRFYRSERSYGRFFRSIPLPQGVDPGQCTAKFENGVLEVTVPVTEQEAAERKLIEIK